MLSNRGAPVSPASHATPSNLASGFAAKVTASSRWESAKTLTAKYVARRKCSSARHAKSMHIRINGGRIDTAVKELMVSPWALPSAARTVATATPVANCEQTLRYRCWSIAVKGWELGIEDSRLAALTRG